MRTSKKGSLYLLVGEDNFLKEEFITKARNKFLEKDSKDLNFTSFSAKDSGINDILGVGATIPFLGKKRVVVIKDVDRLDDRGKKSLFSFLKNPPESTCLILESAKPFAGNEFLNSVSKYAILVKTQSPKYGALNRWITQRAPFFNKRITKDAATFLREQVGENLDLLSRELEKIVSFIGEKQEITSSDVRDVVGRSIKDDVFVLVDCINSKEASKALLLCKRLLEQGKKAHEIIGLIGWHFRKTLLNTQPDSLKKDEVRQKLRLLFNADKTLKSSSLRPGFVLDVLISKLCAT